MPLKEWFVLSFLTRRIHKGVFVSGSPVWGYSSSMFFSVPQQQSSWNLRIKHSSPRRCVYDICTVKSRLSERHLRWHGDDFPPVVHKRLTFPSLLKSSWMNAHCDPQRSLLLSSLLLFFRLALYVYEYLLHVGAQKSAQTFLSEVRSSFSLTSCSARMSVIPPLLYD